MRPCAFLLGGSLVAALVVGCGQPTLPEQTIAAASIPATTIPPTATTVPPTATSEPTPIPPTATVAPTSVTTPVTTAAPTVAA